MFCKYLDKIKIANTSNTKFSLMACKTSLFLLNKINYFYLHWFIVEKSVWSNEGKGRCGLELASSKFRRHNFDFHSSNTVVAVDLFVLIAAAAVVVPVVVVGKDIQG